MTWKRSDLSRRSAAKTEVSRRSAWTKAEIRRARQVPLKPVLEALGYQLQPLRNGNYLLRQLIAEIVVKDHYWVCKDAELAESVEKSAACPEHSRGGNAIDFLVQVQGMRFSEAVDLLLSHDEQPAPS